jgi:twinkle protein
MLFYDHFGSLESERLLTMMRFMAASGCRFIVLDHISIVHSGNETNDERKDIDILMTKLASFVKETGVGVIAVVHLKRGKNYNEGDAISLTDMRGSASIEQLSSTSSARTRPAGRTIRSSLRRCVRSSAASPERPAKRTGSNGM